MSIIEIQDFEGDYKDIFGLLESLTSAPTIDKKVYDFIVANLGNNHKIFLYIKDEIVVGIVTILIEQKLIHNASKVAHIEDLIVDKAYRNQGIASALLKKCIDISQENKCYKIILNCDKSLIKFYEKSEFVATETQMRYYL